MSKRSRVELEQENARLRAALLLLRVQLRDAYDAAMNALGYREADGSAFSSGKGRRL